MIPDKNTTTLEERIDLYIRDFVFRVKSYLHSSYELEYINHGMDMEVNYKDLNRKTKPTHLFAVVYTKESFNKKILITRMSHWMDTIINKDYKCYFIGEFKKLISKISKLHKANNGIIMENGIFYKMQFISSATTKKNVLNYANKFEWNCLPL